MQQAGDHVKEEVCRALIVLISNAPELHAYAARSMYRALKTSIDHADLNLSLVTSTCWFLGRCMLCAGSAHDHSRLATAHALLLYSQANGTQSKCLLQQLQLT